MASRPAEGPAEKTVGRAGFLAGLLGLISLVALSIVGLGHARTIEGAANAQFWIVVAIAAAALGWTTLMLSRTPARSRGGDVLRKLGVVFGALWLALFLWETLAIGTNAFTGPIEFGWAAWRG
ncbi:hypothetical protein [Methylopila sp. M107]|uniref:hypothetical protein n=1 Tax=Methylopila sp. M107 TaxID=1101190 RepID=UPI00037CC61A|nr:hypothetical protein [Methylopila sp. M107]